MVASAHDAPRCPAGRRTVDHVLGAAQAHERHLLPLRLAGGRQEDAGGSRPAVSCAPGAHAAGSRPGAQSASEARMAAVQRERRVAHGAVRGGFAVTRTVTSRRQVLRLRGSACAPVRQRAGDAAAVPGSTRESVLTAAGQALPLPHLRVAPLSQRAGLHARHSAAASMQALNTSLGAAGVAGAARGHRQPGPHCLVPLRPRGVRRAARHTHCVAAAAGGNSFVAGARLAGASGEQDPID